MTLSAAFWILLGAAGVLVPLETAFNPLWGAMDNRPYWRTQAIGRLLTTACGAMAVLFVFGTTAAQALIDQLAPSPAVARAASYTILRLSALGVSMGVIFLFYRFLPNTRLKAGGGGGGCASALGM